MQIDLAFLLCASQHTLAAQALKSAVVGLRVPPEQVSPFRSTLTLLRARASLYLDRLYGHVGWVLPLQLWDVGNDTLRNQDVSGLWKLTVLTSVVSFVFWLYDTYRVKLRGVAFFDVVGPRLTTVERVHITSMTRLHWLVQKPSPTQQHLGARNH